MSNTAKLPAIFVTHGGGPCFFMDWNPSDAWTKMGEWLANISGTLPEKPKAILVISGHWEENDFTVHNGSNPPLLFDYYGFPEHTYQLKYTAPGAQELATQVQKLLTENGIPFNNENKRGWDHGVFIPLKVMFPEAKIPVLQVSLKNNLDVAEHIKLGRALQPLREQGVLIIGSGSSYHNLSAFGPRGKDDSKQFDNWLTETITINDRKKREGRLAEWSKAPSGRVSHPREEHIIPLMVVAGAADNNEEGKKIFSDEVMGVTLSGFQFG